jgi:NAD(P)-dependent dehydrogenase (short-subunit alcohol dehydrogenase family)
MKTWFITGCATGFGAELAGRLAAAAGVNLVATDKDPATLAYLPQQPSVMTLPLDVTRSGDISTGVAAALERFGQIDVLVNNAGLGWGGPFEEMDMAHNRLLFEVNILGMMALTQAVLPHMRGRASGHIINISSDSGIYGQPFSAAYCATKHAVEGFSESLSHEVLLYGIKVTVIEPCGMFQTAMPRDAVAAVERMTTPDSPYYPMIHATLPSVKQNLAEALPPSVVAEAVLEVAAMASPPMRLAVGKPDRTAIVAMRRQMPDEDFIVMLRKGMGLPG